jgi:hypothetical protein
LSGSLFEFFLGQDAVPMRGAERIRVRKGGGGLQASSHRPCTGRQLRATRPAFRLRAGGGRRAVPDDRAAVSRNDAVKWRLACGR